MSAVTIDSAYIKTFESILRHLAQQSITKLRDFVTERSTNGEDHSWERLAANEASLKASRGDNAQPNQGLIETPVNNVEWSRRISPTNTYHAGEATEQEDPVQMIVDPNSNLNMNLAMAMKRQVDDVLITAATGTALDGEGGNNAFPVGQEVGDGTTPISFDFVTEVQEKFMENDIDLDVPKVLVVGPTQIRKLMQATEQTSKDYVRKGLDELSQTGIVPSWMGFTWVMSTRLLEPSPGEKSCLAFTKRALGLQVNRDITARVQEDPSFSFAWRLYCFMTMGAVRVEDEHIVHLHVADSL